MEYSCNDIIKLRSVMPFIPEEPKYINSLINNANSIIYTAPANTSYIITNISYTYQIITSGNIIVQVKNSAGVVQYAIISCISANSFNNNNIITPYFPFEVKSTDYIYLSASATATLYISFMGIERTLSI